MKSVLLLALALTAPGLRAGDDQPLTLVRTIPLPGVSGRFDHFAFDGTGERLFVAALGHDRVEVIDLKQGRVTHEIAGLSEPQGIAFVGTNHRLYVANGGDGAVRAFDATTFAPLGGVALGDDADNVRFDRTDGEIVVGYGGGGLAFIDPARASLVGEIPLPAHPESFQLESSGRRIYVNLPGARRIAVVDRDRRRIVATWPMEAFRANFPMALDERDHRLFVGCRRPARLVVLDTDTGAPVADLALAGDTDDLFYDAARHRIYASCGEGFLDVVAQRDADHYERIARIATRAGARTSFFSPELNELFLAVPERWGREAELRLYTVR